MARSKGHRAMSMLLYLHEMLGSRAGKLDEFRTWSKLCWIPINLSFLCNRAWNSFDPTPLFKQFSCFKQFLVVFSMCSEFHIFRHTYLNLDWFSILAGTAAEARPAVLNDFVLFSFHSIAKWSCCLRTICIVGLFSALLRPLVSAPLSHPWSVRAAAWAARADVVLRAGRTASPLLGTCRPTTGLGTCRSAPGFGGGVTVSGDVTELGGAGCGFISTWRLGDGAYASLPQRRHRPTKPYATSSRPLCGARLCCVARRSLHPLPSHLISPKISCRSWWTASNLEGWSEEGGSFSSIMCYRFGMRTYQAFNK